MKRIFRTAIIISLLFSLYSCTDYGHDPDDKIFKQIGHAHMLGSGGKPHHIVAGQVCTIAFDNVEQIKFNVFDLLGEVLTG